MIIDRSDLQATPPAKDEDSSWWWDALEADAPLFPRCRACGHTYFPPMSSCPWCAAQDIERVPVSGRGRIHSWVVSHKVVEPTFASDVPYVVVAVALDEGPRVMGRLLDEAPELAGGEQVTFTPYRVGDIVLPGFTLVAPREPATTSGSGESRGG